MAMIEQSQWKLTPIDDKWSLVATGSSNGTVCEVTLNQKDRLIKRKFGLDSITVNGSLSKEHSTLTNERITKFFNNEIKWLDTLKHSPWIPKTVDYNIDEQWIIQEFYGPDLLGWNWHDNKDMLKHQVIDMYNDFVKNYDMIKGNGSLSNMTFNPYKQNIIAFDFKWAETIQWRNKEHKNKVDLLLEIRSYWKWLSKIDIELPYYLLQILDDQTP
jgi:hypothetical protein